MFFYFIIKSKIILFYNFIFVKTKNKNINAYCKKLKAAVVSRHALKPAQYGILIISASNLKTFIVNNKLEEYKKVFKSNYDIKY